MTDPILAIPDDILGDFDELAEKLGTARNALITKIIETGANLSHDGFHGWVHDAKDFDQTRPPERYKLKIKKHSTNMQLSLETFYKLDNFARDNMYKYKTEIVVKLMACCSHLSVNGFNDWLASVKEYETQEQANAEELPEDESSPYR